MALENSAYVPDLNQANPTNTDLRRQGDDHFRNLKVAVKQSFELMGAKFSTAGTAPNFTVTTGHQNTPTLKGNHIYSFAVHQAAAGADVVNWDGQGNKAITKFAGGAWVATAAGDWPAGAVLLTYFEPSTNTFRILSGAQDYVRKSGDTMSGGLTVGGAFQANGNANILGIANLQGSYTAIYGDASVCGNGGAFVPSSQLHVGDFGITTALIQARDASQARVQWSVPSRAIIIYQQGDGSTFDGFDLTAGRTMFSYPTNPASEAQVHQPFRVNGYAVVSGRIMALNDSGFELNGGGSDRYIRFGAASSGGRYIQVLHSSGQYLIQNGGAQLRIDGDGSLTQNGVHTFLDTNGHIIHRVYTVGTRPGSAPNAGRSVIFSDYDDGGGSGPSPHLMWGWPTGGWRFVQSSLSGLA